MDKNVNRWCAFTSLKKRNTSIIPSGYEGKKGVERGPLKNYVRNDDDHRKWRWEKGHGWRLPFPAQGETAPPFRARIRAQGGRGTKQKMLGVKTRSDTSRRFSDFVRWHIRLFLWLLLWIECKRFGSGMFKYLLEPHVPYFPPCLSHISYFEYHEHYI